ncbi:MAG: hypothetical protein EOO09_04410 [Chitinophagaceae bacterium]|nr:MAG: hypothetical protein EOO09_04410 [Chitinophagaceae bacterium]
MPRPPRFDYMLQNGLNSWVKGSTMLTAALVRPALFLKYREKDTVEVDLNQLAAEYLLQNVAPDPGKYADMLLLSLEKSMFRTLSFIGIEDYRFTYLFKWQGEIIRRQVNYYFLSRTVKVR